jgi:hypothetical protein
MAERKYTPQEIEIKEGQITLILHPDEAAMLAKACSIAAWHTQNVENQAEIIAFRAYAALFKAATIAAVFQIDMSEQHQNSTKVYVTGLLEMVLSESGSL